ncbi:Glycosyl hydrolase catalytic core [Hyella patelloides LEGE 07179]|uniref:Glycosyl hydrolase catalytic core n=2 Tax=Hyella TaxID=945733 RepID=A0A563VXB1_9CYAN|nr:Glycosyl hydrolase catalytic core [Hyella patelloides LEGE 07179]
MFKTSTNSISWLNFFVLTSLLLISGCSGQKNLGKKSASAQPSTVKASLSSVSRPLSENYACFNVNSLMVKSWSNPEFQQAVRQVNPQLLRIPGGTESNYWDWQKGGLVGNVREAMAGYPIQFRNKDLKYNASKLEDIQGGIKETNTDPIFVLNMATSSLESQLEMLRRARDLGMPVKYIELGNEFYFDVPNYKRVFPTSADYAQTASEWIVAIKQEFPAAEIALVGVAPKPKDSIREQNWQKSLLNSAMYQADAVTLHLYNGHGLKSPIDSNSTYPFFTSEEVPLILGQPFRSWQKLQNNDQLKLIPDNKQIWMTEYNLFENVFGKKNRDKQQRVMGSWTHGLYALTMSLLFLEDSRIAIACNHVLTGNSRFAAIFANKASFLNPSDENFEVQAKSLSATGSTLSLLGEATLGMTKAQKIDFSPEFTLVGHKNFEYPALYGWMFNNGKHSRAIIANLSNRNISVNLEQLFSASVSYQQLSAEPQTLITGKEVIKSKSDTVSPEIMLPAYSVTKLDSLPSF